MRDFFLKMDKLVFEGAEFEKDIDSSKSKDYDSMAVEFSSKLLKAFDEKAEKYNKDKTEDPITSEEIKNVYIQATSSCPKKHLAQINSWSLAKVNMFLRIKDGEYLTSETEDKTIPLLKEISFLEFESPSNLESFARVDVLKPSAEDFLQANEDIKNYNLDYNFKNIEELYLDEYKPLEYYWE